MLGGVGAEEQAGLLAGVFAQVVGEEPHEGFVELGVVAQVALDVAAVRVEPDAGQVGDGGGGGHAVGSFPRA